MKAYSVCVWAQASILWSSGYSDTKNCQITEEVWTMTEQVVKWKTLEDKPRSG